MSAVFDLIFIKNNLHHLKDH